jgi:glycine/D-amino acid oxidase-like deaminating enzyme
MSNSANVLICGAGITGVSTAFYLSKAGVRDILLVDELPPLSLTSDRSTECYRNWWPDPAMLALMDRSIDLLENLADESGNVFHLNRRGYLYLTADVAKIAALKERSNRISSLGAGPVRIHTQSESSYQPAPPEDFHGQPVGADILLGSQLIRNYFPYLTDQVVAALHVRRAGWLSAQQLGMYLLEESRRQDVRFVSARVTGVDVDKNRVQSVHLSNGERIDTPVFINAAGPFFKPVGDMLGIDLPVETELHLKVAFKDHLGVIGRDAPLLIWDDPQLLDWDEDEQQLLSEDPETRWLTESFPSGVHTRPEGAGDSQMTLMLWEYKTQQMKPVWPPPLDESYPEVALRGLSRMLPGLRAYFGKAPRPILDGGYYTKTQENRPLIGPMPVGGAFMIGAVSGFGIMASCASGELLAAHITGEQLPDYASAFMLERYRDPGYKKQLSAWDDSGQL